MAVLMCVHLKQLCLARVQMEGSKGWAGLGLTYLHLDEVGLAKGDELRVRLQLVHVPGLHQGQPVDRALLL